MTTSNLVDPNAVRVRCGFQENSSNNYEVLCHAVVVDANGTETNIPRADNLLFNWVPPVKESGSDFTQSCSVDSLGVSETCTVSLATPAPTLLRFDLGITDKKTQSSRTESTNVLLPFSIQSIGAILQAPRTYHVRSTDASELGPELGFDTNFVPPTINFGIVGSACQWGDKTLFSGGGYVYSLAGGVVTVFAGSPNRANLMNFSYRLRTHFGDNFLGLLCTKDKVWIADQDNQRVISIDAAEHVTQELAQSDLQAQVPTFDGASSIRNIAFGPDGSLYLVDQGRNRILKRDPAGKITTVAGMLTVPNAGGYTGDHGPATSAQLNYPDSVAVDKDGTLYISDTNNNVIRKVDPKGIITTFAGASQDLLTPTGILFAPDHSLIAANSGDATVVSISPLGVVTTIVGTLGSAGFSGDGGPATQGKLNQPEGVSYGPDGTMYIADSFNHRVRAVSPGGLLSTLAGSAAQITSTPTGDGGPATSASLTSAYGTAISDDGTVFITDTYRGTIRKVDSAGVISTFATGLNHPFGIRWKGGLLYAADTGNNQVVRINSSGTVSIFAGNLGNPGYGGDGGLAVNAALLAPQAAAIASDGTVYIADTGNSVIRKVDLNGKISTIAGTGNAGFNGDGVATAVMLNQPAGVAVRSDGTVLISDGGNQFIRLVDASGHLVTIAGSSRAGGYAGDGGPALSALLKTPGDLSVSSDGRIFFADTGNGVIRLLTPVAGSNPPSYLISTLFGGATSTDCGQGVLKSAATANMIGELLNADLGVMCLAHILSFDARLNCPTGRARFAFGQEISPITNQGSAISIDSPCLAP